MAGFWDPLPLAKAGTL